jgi:hypothetical protein
LNESSSTSDYVTKVKASGFVVERVNSSTLNREKENTTRQERLRSAFLPLGSEALDTNYTVKSFQVTLSKNCSHGIIEGELIRDGGGNDAGATGIKKLGKAIVEFPMKEIKDAERTDSIEHMLIMNSAVTQLALQVELMFYELGD